MTYPAISPADFDMLVALAASQAPPTDPVGVAMLFFIESGGWDPANPGPPGALPPVAGLNQMNTPNLTDLGLTRAQWLTMTASAQLPVIFRFWQGLAKDYNGGAFPADGAHLLALNMAPGAYKVAGASSNSSAVIAGKAGPYASVYGGNAYYDPDATGTVTVNSIAKRYALVDAETGTPAAARWAQIKQGIAAAQARRAAAAASGVAMLGGSSPSLGGGSRPPGSTTRPPAGGGGLFALALALGFVWLRASGTRKGARL